MSRKLNDPKVVNTPDIPDMNKRIYEAVYAICKFLKDKLDVNHKLKDRDFHQQFRFTHKKKQLAKDYTPMVFREIRQVRGVDERRYLKSLLNKGYHCLGKNLGKSGACLYQTNDRRYYLKTISKNEKTFVVSMLRAYVHYLRNNPGTFLLNIFGVFRLKDKNMIGGIPSDLYFMVSQNILPISKQVGQIFDLKGSSIGRKFDPQRQKPGQVTIYKDLDLSRKLRFGKLKRKAILRQLNADSCFLRQLGVMDYSLLLGIVRKKRFVEKKPILNTVSEERRKKKRVNLIVKKPPPPSSFVKMRVKGNQKKITSPSRTSPPKTTKTIKKLIPPKNPNPKALPPNPKRSSTPKTTNPKVAMNTKKPTNLKVSTNPIPKDTDPKVAPNLKKATVPMKSPTTPTTKDGKKYSKMWVKNRSGTPTTTTTTTETTETTETTTTTTTDTKSIDEEEIINKNIEFARSNIDVNSEEMKGRVRTSIRFWRQEQRKDQTIPVPFLRPPPIPKKENRPPTTTGKDSDDELDDKSPSTTTSKNDNENLEIPVNELKKKTAPRPPSADGASRRHSKKLRRRNNRKKASFQDKGGRIYTSLRRNTIVRNFPNDDRKTLSFKKIQRPKPPGSTKRTRKRSLPPTQTPILNRGKSVQNEVVRKSKEVVSKKKRGARSDFVWKRNASVDNVSKGLNSTPGTSSNPFHSILKKIKKKSNVEFLNVEIGSIDKIVEVETLKENIQKEDERQRKNMMKKLNQSTSNLKDFFGRSDEEDGNISKAKNPSRSSNKPFGDRRRSRSYGNLSEHIDDWKRSYQQQRRTILPEDIVPPVEQREDTSLSYSNDEDDDEETEDRPQAIKKKKGGGFFNMLRKLQTESDKGRQQHGTFVLGISHENEGFKLESKEIDNDSGICIEEEVFFGVIDITQQYGIKKKAALAIRGIKYDKKKLSSIEPGEYQTRFIKFLSQHFVE